METSETKILRESGVKVGFIGGGNIAQAIIAGALSSGNVVSSQLLVSAPTDRNLKKLKVHNCATTHSNSEVVKNCQIIILACKPYQINGVAKEVFKSMSSNHLVLSTAAGVSIKTLESYFPVGTHVVRTLPNVACAVQAGGVMVVHGANANAADIDKVNALFEGVAKCFVVTDEQIEAASGVLGCGIAFGAMVAEALSDGGVMVGLPRAEATQMAAQMLLGAAKLIQEGNKHPGEIKDSVTSPGGTTIRGVHALEKGGFRGLLMNAVEATTIRAEQMQPKK